ncbi:hypothetical protein [Novosphingobium ovatum]|uniref:hypothetical protein n=1 Tax=Novosphingobium ovatum TaxID=1908523 RepID=UPI00191C1FA2|nr:hypothetical protein [Novosphingobium ovatum]
MRIAYHASRIIFGLWFLFSGCEYFLPQLGLQPLGHTALAQEFTLAMIHSGLFTVVKIAEVVIGIACLANRAMPLMMAATAPLSFVIVWWNVVLDPGVIEWIFAVLTGGMNALMLWVLRAYYLPMFVWLSPVPSPARPA